MTAAAAPSLLLIGSAPALLIEVFWLLAVAYLLAGRWPNGEPPAWSQRTGGAVAVGGGGFREQRQRVAGRSDGRGTSQPKPASAPAREAVGAAAQGPRSGAAKRKRKRRK